MSQFFKFLQEAHTMNDQAHNQYRAIQLEDAVGEPRNASDNPTMG